MKQLRVGDFVVHVDIDGTDLAGFLDRIGSAEPSRSPTHRLTIRRASTVSLIVDSREHTITLTLPVDASGPTILIGVLQALTRGLAYVERRTGTRALLHGSAFTVDDGAAVAVLDGGLGQGKTSLAVGLARQHGRLLVDEFAFARTTPAEVVLSAAPTLPWHIRADIAPYLTPSPGTLRTLHYPDQLRPTATSTVDAPLRLILLPDRSLPAGDTAPVSPDRIQTLLHRAVTDHLRKLTNPALDHVSIFTSASEITDPAGRPLLEDVAHTEPGMLNRLAAIPTARVGIGHPADLPASVAAAGQLVEAVTR